MVVYVLHYMFCHRFVSLFLSMPIYYVSEVDCAAHLFSAVFHFRFTNMVMRDFN